MWKLIKFVFKIYIVLFILIPFLVGLALSQAHSQSLTPLEQSYVKDANHALYIYVVNQKCNYVSMTTLSTLTDGVIKTTKVAVGEKRLNEYDATQGRQVLMKIAEIGNYMKSLKGDQLKKVCREHRTEFNQIYRYLASLSDESGESADN